MRENCSSRSWAKNPRNRPYSSANPWFTPQKSPWPACWQNQGLLNPWDVYLELVVVHKPLYSQKAPSLVLGVGINFTLPLD